MSLHADFSDNYGKKIVTTSKQTQTQTQPKPKPKQDKKKP